jgi:ribose transport system substrate-binding protein
VVALFSTLENDYYVGWNEGAKRAVESLGGEYRPFVNENDPARELAQFQRQVQAGVKHVFMTAPDPSNIPRMAQVANQNRVYLTNTWESPAWYSPFEPGPYYVTYFTPNSFEVGYITAKALCQEMGGKGNLVHISGFPGATPDWQRTEGLKRAVSEFPGIKIVASQPGRWNRDDSRVAMAGIIRRLGRNIDGVFGQNDDCGIGAMNALQEAGITDVPITGIDGNKGTMEFIKAGRYFAAYSSFPWWQAGYSAIRAIDASLGFKPTAAERQMWTGGALITKDNVDAYLQRFVEGDPYDWTLMSRVAAKGNWDPQNQVSPMVMEQMWQGQPKPRGFEEPAPYRRARQRGELERTKRLYQAHNKRKVFEA